MPVDVTLVPLLGDRFPGSREAVAAALESLPVVRVLARSRTTEAAVVALPDGGPPATAVRKRWWWPRARDRLRGALRTTVAAPSPARREWAALLRLAGIAIDGGFAPGPYGVSERRRGGVLHACLLLLEEIPGATDLATFLGAERDPARRSAALADLARRTRAMHDAGLLDREHHPRNVLVGPSCDGRLRTWKVDCWKQRVLRGPLAPGRAVEDLAAIDVGLVRLAAASERTEFLREYLGHAPDPEFRALLDAARARIDARECLRLPATGCPADNDR